MHTAQVLSHGAASTLRPQALLVRSVCLTHVGLSKDPFMSLHTSLPEDDANPKDTGHAVVCHMPHQLGVARVVRAGRVTSSTE